MSNIIDLLISDHNDFKEMLKSLTAITKVSQEADLFRKLFDRVKGHARFEETSVYPLLTINSDTNEIALEAFEEHHQFLHLFQTLKDLNATDNSFMAKIHVLNEDITHHILEEEKNLFPQLRASNTEATLHMIGITYQKMIDTAQSQAANVDEHIRVR
jgi:hemerythrin superfamily protein